MALCQVVHWSDRSSPEGLRLSEVGSGGNGLLYKMGGGWAISQNYSEQKFIDFVWKNIICHFRILNKIVFDNETQFDSAKFKDFWDNFGILKTFSTLAHPQSNEPVEAVNETIKQTLKKKLSKLKGIWVNKLRLMLWSY